MAATDNSTSSVPSETSSQSSSTISKAWTWTLRSIGISSTPSQPQPQQQKSPELTSSPEPISQPKPEPFIVAPEIWENPYHPLPGPPETPEQAAQLQRIIQSEREAVSSSIARKLGPSDLETAARNNCSDLEWAYHWCLRNGGLRERATLCSEKKERFMRCFKMQKRNFDELGYANPSLTDRERAIIADQADQKYLNEIAEEEKAKASGRAEAEAMANA